MAKRNTKNSVNVKSFDELAEEVKQSWSQETRMIYESSILAFQDEFRE